MNNEGTTNPKIKEVADCRLSSRLIFTHLSAYLEFDVTKLFNLFLTLDWNFGGQKKVQLLQVNCINSATSEYQVIPQYNQHSMNITKK